MRHIRLLQDADLRRTAELEAASFSDAWTQTELKSLLRLPAVSGWGLWEDGRLAAFCLVQQAADEGEILRIAAAPDRQRQGLGTALLTEVFGESPQTKFWYLEVRESNRAAMRLYEKMGFFLLDIRENYYRNPMEAACILRRESPDLQEGQE